MTATMTDIPTLLATAGRCDSDTAHLFTGELGDPPDWEAARSICRLCPIQATCLEWALEHPEQHQHSMMGGATPTERRKMQKTGMRPLW